jgi:hypothetical protein
MQQIVHGQLSLDERRRLVSDFNHEIIIVRATADCNCNPINAFDVPTANSHSASLVDAM